MIGVDWGTSSFRAFRMSGDGTILDRRASPRGIMSVEGGGFAEILRDEVGAWLSAGEDRVLLSGMIGSRQGWKEAPYVRCPAGAVELSAGLVDVAFEGARVKLVPGVSGVDAAGVAEVMRGEETQLIGALAAMGGSGLACLPGTHSKWVRMEDGRIASYTTYMTGEVYAALRQHTILGRMMKDTPVDGAAFDEGVRRSGQPGGLLHHIFGVRAETLAGKLSETDSGAYLSGILFGHEVRAALADAPRTAVHIIGAPALAALSARAIAACGWPVHRHDEEAAARGLAAIGEHAPWN